MSTADSKKIGEEQNIADNIKFVKSNGVYWPCFVSYDGVDRIQKYLVEKRFPCFKNASFFVLKQTLKLVSTQSFLAFQPVAINLGNARLLPYKEEDSLDILMNTATALKIAVEALGDGTKAFQCWGNAFFHASKIMEANQEKFDDVDDVDDSYFMDLDSVEEEEEEDSVEQPLIQQTQPITPIKKNQVHPTTPIKKNQVHPTTPIKKNQVHPTTPIKKNQVQPTTPIKKNQVQPTTPIKKNQVQPTTPIKKNQVQPTTPIKKNQVQPTTPAKKTPSVSKPTSSTNPYLRQVSDSEGPDSPDSKVSSASTVDSDSVETTKLSPLNLLATSAESMERPSETKIQHDAAHMIVANNPTTNNEITGSNKRPAQDQPCPLSAKKMKGPMTVVMSPKQENTLANSMLITPIRKGASRRITEKRINPAPEALFRVDEPINFDRFPDFDRTKLEPFIIRARKIIAEDIAKGEKQNRNYYYRSNVLRLMQDLGVELTTGDHLANYFYLLPGGKGVQHGKRGIDYVDNEEDLSKIAIEHLGWVGETISLDSASGKRRRRSRLMEDSPEKTGAQ